MAENSFKDGEIKLAVVSLTLTKIIKQFKPNNQKCQTKLNHSCPILKEQYDTFNCSAIDPNYPAILENQSQEARYEKRPPCSHKKRKHNKLQTNNTFVVFGLIHSRDRWATITFFHWAQGGEKLFSFIKDLYVSSKLFQASPCSDQRSKMSFVWLHMRMWWNLLITYLRMLLCEGKKTLAS